ncbi:hypothetical protein IAT38_003348 [Cryptococcus sp. DSM 104549]
MSALELISQLPSSFAEVARGAIANISASLSSDEKSLLPFIPKPVKAGLLFIALLYYPSWPFKWHIRFWGNAIKELIVGRIKGPAKYIEGWKKASAGSEGIRRVVKQKKVAWVDDCDYNMHLSNSAYAKNADSAKMDWAVEALGPVLVISGLGFGMGATHYSFFKEVPIGVPYVMECRCGGWDEKWLYTIVEFIIYPKKKSTKAVFSAKSHMPTPDGSKFLPQMSAPPTPDPSAPTSGTATPNPAATAGTDAGSNAVDAIKRAWAQRREANPRKDGGVVCGMQISEYCFKIGRITVPPRIVVWINGYATDKAEQDRARALLLAKDGGRKFLRGGWREEPDAATLGTAIGTEGGDNWVTQGREGLEKIVSGMSVF